MTILPPTSSGPADDESGDAASAAMLGRAVASLQRFPDVPPGAVDRVVAAAVARNGVAGRRSVAATWLARAAVLALAAGLGAVSATYTLGRRAAAPDAAAEVAAEVASLAQPAPLPNAIGRQAAAVEEGPIATPFVLARPAAHRVAVVGDFNGWDPTANVMTTDARGVWTTTVALPPGRHAYAFVVDGAAWVTDPRAPVVRDADYGRDQSVVLVGHP